nr:MAG TPA: hypothetical protein [Caudoviricetes sp.]
MKRCSRECRFFHVQTVKFLLKKRVFLRKK